MIYNKTYARLGAKVGAAIGTALPIVAVRYLQCPQSQSAEEEAFYWTISTIFSIPASIVGFALGTITGMVTGMELDKSRNNKLRKLEKL